MRLGLVGKKMQGTAHFRRESACFDRIGLHLFVSYTAACTFKSLGYEHSNSHTPYCQHRYPSPVRSALFQSRPATSCAQSYAKEVSRLAPHQFFRDSSVIKQILKGEFLCLIDHGSSLPQRLSASLAALASTTMPSVRLQVQVLAALRVKCLTTIVQPARWLAALRVRSQTTSNNGSPVPADGFDIANWNVARDFPLAAFFCSRDPSHV